MKQLLLFLVVLLTGCSAKDRAYRLIYVENPTETRFYNTRGEECILSGQDVDPTVYEGKKYPEVVKLLETYKNCDFRRVRILNHREKLMWGIDYERIERERLERKRKGLPQ